MSDHTLRVPDATYQTIKKLAGEETTIQAVVVQAVEALRRQRFWEQFNADYAALKADPAAWAEELAERAAWDCALLDGLEPEEWGPDKIESQDQEGGRPC